MRHNHDPNTSRISCIAYSNLKKHFTKILTLGVILLSINTIVHSQEYIRVNDSKNPFAFIDIQYRSKKTGDNWASFAFTDLNHHRGKELVVWEGGSNLVYYENLGNGKVEFIRTKKQLMLSTPLNPLDFMDYPGITFVDINGDSLEDLVIGGSGELQYFKRIDRKFGPFFQKVADSENPFSGVGVGISSRPVFIDYDNDKDLDMIIGKVSSPPSRLTWYKQTTHGGKPTFKEVSDLYLNKSGSLFPPSPALIDLDSDGDQDLVASVGDGTFTYLFNQENNAFHVLDSYWNFVQRDNPYMETIPVFEDLDYDGVPEMILGTNGEQNKSGKIEYYVKNTLGADENRRINYSKGLEVFGGSKLHGETSIYDLTTTQIANLNGGATTTNLTATGTTNLQGLTTVDDLVTTQIANLNGGATTTNLTATGTTNLQGLTTVDDLVTTQIASLNGGATASSLTVSGITNLNGKTNAESISSSSLGVTGHTSSGSLGVTGDISSNNLSFTGYLLLNGSGEIFTSNSTNKDWRIGFNEYDSISNVNLHNDLDFYQYITYSNDYMDNGDYDSGFVLGQNGKKSSLEIWGDHQSFFRGDMQLGLNNKTERANLHVSGNVGIGTNSPNPEGVSLNVNGGISAAGIISTGTVDLSKATTTYGEISTDKSISLTDNAQIYTAGQTNSDYRFGFNANGTRTAKIETYAADREYNFITYSSEEFPTDNNGFVIGHNKGKSSFELYENHNSFFRGDMQIGLNETGQQSNLNITGKLGIGTDLPNPNGITLNVNGGISVAGITSTGTVDLSKATTTYGTINTSQKANLNGGINASGTVDLTKANLKLGAITTDNPISLNGNAQIYTNGISNSDYRIGFNKYRAKNSKMSTYRINEDYNFITFPNDEAPGTRSGFAIGHNMGESSFEIYGDHSAFFRGNISIRRDENSRSGILLQQSPKPYDLTVNGTTFTSDLQLDGYLALSDKSQIFTSSIKDQNWRIGYQGILNQNKSNITLNNKDLDNFNFITYADDYDYRNAHQKDSGFVIGENGGNSSLEIYGNNESFFRGDMQIGTNEAKETANLFVTGKLGVGIDANGGDDELLISNDTYDPVSIKMQADAKDDTNYWSIIATADSLSIQSDHDLGINDDEYLPMIIKDDKVGMVNAGISKSLGIGTKEAIEGTSLTVFGHTYLGSKASYEKKRAKIYPETAQEYMLWVDGDIAINGEAMAVDRSMDKWDKSVWPDYVFDDDYELMSINELKRKIDQYGHLPYIPSAKEITADGYGVHYLNKRFLRTMEELTLHTIQQEEKIEQLASELKEIKELLKNINQ